MSNSKVHQRDPLYVVEPLVTNPTKKIIGKSLVWFSFLLMICLAIIQFLKINETISFGFVTWRPVLYAYIFWGFSIGYSRVLIYGEKGKRSLFVIPAVLFIISIVIFPLIFGLYVSFTDWNLSSFEGRKFNGLDNFYQMLSDPYYLGGGAMITETGGYLNVHVDFNWHQKLQAWRKCNVLFYLTPDWDESYKGNLEFWSIDGKEKIKEVSPIFNRVVVFDTTSKSYHGQPEPIKSPNNIPRRVFSAFYYSTIKNEDTDSAPHYTKYSDDKRNQKANFKTSPYAEKIKQDYLKN